MKKTLILSFSLKITYRVNGILYSLKQIPLVKKLLPGELYGMHWLKIVASVLSVIWEVASVFLGKFLYLLLMVFLPCLLYDGLPGQEVFLHILLFLTVIGGFANTTLFNPTKDKYYAIILMRMDAREYTLVNYGYSILKVVIGFLPCSLLFGLLGGVPVWLCLLLPFSVAGYKLSYVSYTLWDYERRGNVYNENKLDKFQWLGIALLLLAAYGLPAFGLVLPMGIPAVLALLSILLGAAGIPRIYRFGEYKEVCRTLLSDTMSQMDASSRSVRTVKQANEKKISADVSITSKKSGFEYLNELFVRRHRKILWKSAERISYVCAALTVGALLALYLKPQLRPMANKLVMTCLPYFAFILYAINRGTSFTQALFMNCDHSLLTYSFYKRPGFVLKLFRIRLREIMKINAVPALILGFGLALVLLVSGGTDQPVNYVVLVVSMVCMSLFFSVHYLTIYYLLQPYTVGTELKGGTYKLVSIATYMVCYFLMQLRMPTLVFGGMTIVFCVLYGVVACILVYKLAPKTFRLRMG
nr:hypothetical protein [uncultured Acetatifactor sp.]